MVELSEGFGEYEGLGPYRKREKPEELSLSHPEEKTEIGAKSDMSKAEVFYRDVLDFVTNILDKAAEGKEDRINAEEILEHAAAYCEVLSESLVPDDLVHLVFQHDEYRDNYLYTHSVNVCLIAVRIARELNFSKSAMQELIIASLFHDIGMMKISTDIWNKDGGLSGGEYEEVRKHPACGEEIFKSLSGISEVVPTVIGQHHEKVDGSGYPNRLTKDNIHFMARLIGLVDSYVARIHTRLWRPRYLPDKAIQEILDQEGNYYDPYFMKAMLRYISIFPVGSWVRISSGEIGNVVRPNEVIPMRPVLNVVFDRKGVKLQNPRMLDLSKQLLIHVEECIEPEMLEVEVEK